jgi:hypothetical protein
MNTLCQWNHVLFDLILRTMVLIIVVTYAQFDSNIHILYVFGAF